MNLLIALTHDWINAHFLRAEGVLRAANDRHCAGCGAVQCSCPDPVWSGAVPPSAA